MKQFAGLLLTAVFVLSCNSDKSRLRSDLEISNLKGNIWKIQRTIHKVGDMVKCPACQRDNDKNSFYVYNEKGNLIKCSEMDDNGDTVLVLKYIYNSRGICSEIEKYADNKLTGREVNTLKGIKVIEVKEYNEEGIIEGIYKYEYSDNEVTGGTTLNKNGEVVSSFHNDFLNGQISAQEEKNSAGEIWTVTKYKRNSNNDIIESERNYLKDKSVYSPTFAYEYDNQGNWVKQTQFLDGQIAAIILRDITYYNN
jgi:hypothetical protein